MSEGGDALTLRNVVRALRRRVGVIVACTVVVAGSALAFSLLQTEQYSATSVPLFRSSSFSQQLFGGAAGPAPNSSSTSDRDAATNVSLVSLKTVASLTAEKLGNISSGKVASEVSVATGGQANTASVTATDPNPNRAAEIANAYTQSFVAFRRAADRKRIQQAERLVTAQFERLTPAEAKTNQALFLQKQIARLQTLRDIQTGNAEVVQEASPPSSPSSPDVTRNTAFGLALGLLLGIAAALLLERFDRRIKDPSELEEAFSYPVLGTVPQSGVLESLRHGGPPKPGHMEELPFRESEAFRMLRTRLRYFNVDRELRSLVITSALPGEGKSTVAFNLAATAAEAGAKVLLLEADFHNQTLARSFTLAPLPGLAEVITGQSSLDQAIQQIRVPDRANGSEGRGARGRGVGGASPPNPVELLESQQMAKLLDEATDRGYELVVLDTPPASVLADAIPLIKVTSGVLVVSQLGKLTREDAAHLRDQLVKLDAPVLGVIGNRTRSKGHGYYGYGYYYGGGDGEPPPRRGFGALRRKREENGGPPPESAENEAPEPAPAENEAPEPAPAENEAPEPEPTSPSSADWSPRSRAVTRTHALH